MVNVSEVIRTMHRKSGLAYERISMLAGFEVTFLERALREGHDMRVDDFCSIADVCGYTLCVRGRFGTLTIRRLVGECGRGDVCASEVAPRIYEAAKGGLADPKEMSASERRLLAALVLRREMPEVTSLARLCRMAGCEIYVRRFREFYALDPDVPEKDVEVVVRQGMPLRETTRDREREAMEQRAANSLGAVGAASKRAPSRKAKSKPRQAPKPKTNVRRGPSGAECTIDDKFRAFVGSFG